MDPKIIPPQKKKICSKYANKDVKDYIYEIHKNFANSNVYLQLLFNLTHPNKTPDPCYGFTFDRTDAQKKIRYGDDIEDFTNTSTNYDVITFLILSAILIYFCIKK